MQEKTEQSYFSSVADILTLKYVRGSWGTLRKFQIIVGDVIMGGFIQPFSSIFASLLVTDIVSQIVDSRSFFNSVTGANFNALELTGLYIGVVSYSYMSKSIRQFVTYGVRGKADYHIAVNLAEHILRQNCEYIDIPNKKKSLISAISQFKFADELYKNVADDIWPGITEIWMSTLVMSFYYNFVNGSWQIALIWGGGGVAYIAVNSLVVFKFFKPKFLHVNNILAPNVEKSSLDIISYHDTIITLNRANVQKSKVDKAALEYAHYLDAAYAKISLINIFKNLVPALILSGFTLNIYYDHGGINPPDLTDLLIIFNYVTPFFTTLSKLTDQLTQSVRTSARMQLLVKELTEMNRYENSINASNFDIIVNNPIEIPNVPVLTFKVENFFYSSNMKKRILTNVDFSANPGSVIVIAGFSGCGKTTIFNIILKLCNMPNQCRIGADIRLNDHNLFTLSNEYLRSRVCYLPQTIQVFSDMSLLYNICYGATNITDEQLSVIEALNKYDNTMSIYGDIESLILNLEELNIFKEILPLKNKLITLLKSYNVQLSPYRVNSLLNELIKVKTKIAKFIKEEQTQEQIPHGNRSGYIPVDTSIDIANEPNESEKVLANIVKHRIKFHMDQLQKLQNRLAHNESITITDIQYKAFSSAVKSLEGRCIEAAIGAGLKELLKSSKEEGVYKLPFAPIGKISGGQAQRIGIARMLMNKEASLYLLDEPTASLDPYVGFSIVEKMMKERNKSSSVIIITHHLNLAKRISNAYNGQILVFGKTPQNEGTMVECGSHDFLTWKNNKDATLSQNVPKRVGLYRDLFSYQQGEIPHDGDKVIKKYRNESVENQDLSGDFVINSQQYSVDPYNRNYWYSDEDGYKLLISIRKNRLIYKSNSSNEYPIQGNELYSATRENANGVFIANPYYQYKFADRMEDDIKIISGTHEILERNNKWLQMPNTLIIPIIANIHWRCVKITIDYEKRNIRVLWDDPYGVGGFYEDLKRQLSAVIFASCQRLIRTYFDDIDLELNPDKNILYVEKPIDQQGRAINGSDCGPITFSNIDDYAKHDSVDDVEGGDFADYYSIGLYSNNDHQNQILRRRNFDRNIIEEMGGVDLAVKPEQDPMKLAERKFQLSRLQLQNYADEALLQKIQEFSDVAFGLFIDYIDRQLDNNDGKLDVVKAYDYTITLIKENDAAIAHKEMRSSATSIFKM